MAKAPAQLEQVAWPGKALPTNTLMAKYNGGAWFEYDGITDLADGRGLEVTYARFGKKETDDSGCGIATIMLISYQRPMVPSVSEPAVS